MPEYQSIVDAVATRHPGLVRLTVHAVPPGERSPRVVASTSAAKRGKPSDPEDLQAFNTGGAVVLEEPGALDVTVPILLENGKPTAVTGVTLEAKLDADRRALELRAREIAAEVESAIVSLRR